MKITNEMVTELNKELVNKGCPFRYEYDEAGYTGNPHMKITLPSMNCIDSFIINPTKEFFDWLELWFKLKGVELGCNNDGSIMWSNNGWSDITEKKFKSGDKVYHKNLKEYGTFVDYAWNSDEECHVDFVMNNTIEQRHVSVSCLCFADEI